MPTKRKEKKQDPQAEVSAELDIAFTIRCPCGDAWSYSPESNGLGKFLRGEFRDQVGGGGETDMYVPWTCPHCGETRRLVAFRV